VPLVEGAFGYGESKHGLYCAKNRVLHHYSHQFQHQAIAHSRFQKFGRD
jgi:hypothetical protein